MYIFDAEGWKMKNINKLIVIQKCPVINKKIEVMYSKKSGKNFCTQSYNNGYFDGYNFCDNEFNSRCCNNCKDINTCGTANQIIEMQRESKHMDFPDIRGIVRCREFKSKTA